MSTMTRSSTGFGDPSLLSALIRDESDPADIAATLRQQAINFLLEDAAFRNSADDSADEINLAHQPLWEAARPHLSNVGGGRRVLAVVPDGLSTAQWKQKLEDEFGNCVSICPSADQELFICCESVGITNEAILSQISYQQPHLADIADRLHTRIDINW